MLYSAEAVLALHRSRLEEAEARRMSKRARQQPKRSTGRRRPVVLRSAEAR